MTGRPRVVVVQNSRRSGPGPLAGWLADDGVDTAVVPGADLAGVEVPAGRGDAAVDGLILLGGSFMPDDDGRAPFLSRERELVDAALAADVPVFGICLGAQLLALVAGGEVTARSGETERGSCTVELLADADDDPLFTGLRPRRTLRMIQNHADSITRLPPGAVHLATSTACRVQAFRVGTAAWGVQFHPEAEPSRIAEWDADTLAAEGLDREALRAQAEADAPASRAHARALLDSFAAIVRGDG